MSLSKRQNFSNSRCAFRIFLIFFAMSVAASLRSPLIASESISGAFGIKLGEKLRAEVILGVEKDFDERQIRRIRVSEPNSKFGRYLAYITPRSGLVYRINAYGAELLDPATCRSDEAKLRAALLTKYGSGSFDYYGFLTIGDGRIYLDCTISNDALNPFSKRLFLSYSNPSLEQAAEAEQKLMDQERRARRPVDKKGL